MTTQHAPVGGTPPPISKNELKEIEARGWVFSESNRDHSAKNERLGEETQDCATVEEVVECILAIEYQIEQNLIKPGEGINLDLVPDDPEGRYWSQLGDYDLTLWRKALRGDEEPNAEEYRKRVDLLILLRDEVEKLAADRSFDMPAGLDESRATYAGCLKALEVVEAEKRRRAEPPPPDDSITIDVGKLREEEAAGSLSPVIPEEMDGELAPDDNSLIHHPSFVQAALFDYSQLETEVADRVQRNTRDIRERIVSTVRNMLVIGQKLRDNKSILGRRHYTEWLAKEIGISEDSSARYIRLADYVDDNPQFAEILPRFSKTAAHMLTAPSTPEEVREEMTQRAAAGETVTTTAARQIVETHKVTRRTESVSQPANNISEESTAGENGGAPPVDAEVVATGRTLDDLLSLLKAHPDEGMLHSDLIRMGFTEALIEHARVENRIEKTIGKWYPVQGAASSKRSTQVGEEKEKRAQVEELLEGKSLSVSFSFIPQVKGRVTVGVCVGDDKTKSLFESFDSGKVKFPEPVLDLIGRAIKTSEAEAKKQKSASAPKKASSKATATKPTSTSKPKSKTTSAARKSAAKPAAKKPAAASKATKKATAAQKTGGGGRRKG